MDKKTETLRITNTSIIAKIFVVSARDKETNQFIVFSPTFDISGYGESKELSFEMFNDSMNEHFSELIKLKSKDRNAYLTSIGWKNENIKTKNYSHVHIDENGKLQGFELDDVKGELLEVA